MATESSSTAASRRSGVGQPALIECPRCHRHTVVRCRSKQQWSKDQVFYTCPDHNKDGTGCPFFLWEAGYISYLEKEAGKEKATVMQGDGVNESLLEHHVDLGTRDATAVQADLRTLINIGYDIAGLLKCIICMCLVIVVVQLLLLFIGLKK